MIAEYRAPRSYSQPRTSDEEVARGAIVYNECRARVDQRSAQIFGQHQFANQYHRKEQHGNDLAQPLLLRQPDSQDKDQRHFDKLTGLKGESANIDPVFSPIGA